MTAAQVLLDDSAFWLVVALMLFASVAAILASIAAWRAAKSARVALSQLEAARREAVVTDREWREGSPIPRRSSDAASAAAVGVGVAVGRSPVHRPSPPEPPPVAAAGPETAADTTGAAPAARPEAAQEMRPAAVGAAAATAAAARARRADTLEDPDRGAGAPPADLPPRWVTAAPEGLRTEPLSRPPRPMASEEREVEPGVFVTTPGGTPAAPGPARAPRSDAPAAGPKPTEASRPVAPRSEPAASANPPAASPPAPHPAPAPAAEPPPTEAADPRLQRLDDPDPFVRIEAMGQLRGHPGLVDVLVRRLQDDFPVVRRQAVRALKEAGTPEATKALLEVAGQDPSAEVREEAVLALAALLGGRKGQAGEGPGVARDAPRNGTDET